MKHFRVYLLLSIFACSALVACLCLNINDLENASVLKKDVVKDPRDTKDLPTSANVNYTWEVVPYSWEDLESSYDVNISSSFTNGPDDGYYQYSLPFGSGFPFYNNTFWSVQICTNGFISFAFQGATQYNNFNFPLSDPYSRYMIAAFWDDLEVGNGSIYIKNAFNKWIVEYKNVRHLSTNYYFSFEIVLYQDGGIQFNFEKVDDISYGYTCGINFGFLNKYSQYYGINSGTNALSVRFSKFQTITIFYDDFESGPSKWKGFSADNYWHISSRAYYSYDHSLWCGNESTGSYLKKVNGENVSFTEIVATQNLDLKDLLSASLKFWFRKNTTSDSGDYLSVFVRVSGSDYYLTKYSNKNFELNSTFPESNWTKSEYDISAFCGYDNVEILFVFAANNWKNVNFGVAIDNVSIIGLKELDTLDTSGSSLCVKEGDEFYYYINIMDSSLYNQIFFKTPFGNGENTFKIKVYSIVDLSDRWEITVRYWDPWDDFESIGAGEELVYCVYKNPRNTKDGTDFLLPCNDVWGYLEVADNIESYPTKYNVDHWYNSGDDRYSLRFDFDVFGVELFYRSDGILERMRAYRKPDWSTIYEFGMYYGEDYIDEPKKEDGKSMEDVTIEIPGYDVSIIFLAIGTMSLLFVQKAKKTRFK